MLETYPIRLRSGRHVGYAEQFLDRDIRGAAEHGARFSHLLDTALPHNRQTMPNGESILQVVSHVDDYQRGFRLKLY